MESLKGRERKREDPRVQSQTGQETADLGLASFFLKKRKKKIQQFFKREKGRSFNRSERERESRAEKRKSEAKQNRTGLLSSLTL